MLSSVLDLFVRVREVDPCILWKHYSLLEAGRGRKIICSINENDLQEKVNMSRNDDTDNLSVISLRTGNVK
jgi:hypothetical protein